MILAETLDAAIGQLLGNGKSPTPRTGELDNRGSHFYVALYWTQALAKRTGDETLQDYFTPLARMLAKPGPDPTLAVLDDRAAVGEGIDPTLQSDSPMHS